MNTNYTIEKVSSLDSSIVEGLAEITLDVVVGGASVGFMSPFSLEKATRFWEKVKMRVERGEVMWMKPLLLHASNKSTSDRNRRVIHLEFASKELPKGLQWRERT